MSSRILKPDTASAPMTWRRLRGAGAEADRENVGGAQRPDASAVPGAPNPDLEREIAQRVAEANRRGFAEGEAHARQAAAAQFQAAIEGLARSATEIAALRPRIHRESEADLVRLAVAVARRVLRRELTVNPDALVGLVKAALDKLDLRELNRIRAHPAAAPLLERMLSGNAMPVRIEVVADASLEPGAAIFETSRGTLDGSVETQLAEIERGLTDLLERPA